MSTNPSDQWQGWFRAASVPGRRRAPWEPVASGATYHEALARLRAVAGRQPGDRAVMLKGAHPADSPDTLLRRRRCARRGS